LIQVAAETRPVVVDTELVRAKLAAALSEVEMVVLKPAVPGCSLAFARAMRWDLPM